MEPKRNQINFLWALEGQISFYIHSATLHQFFGLTYSCEFIWKIHERAGSMTNVYAQTDRKEGRKEVKKTSAINFL